MPGGGVGEHGEMSDAIEAVIDALPGRETLCGAVRISSDGEPLFERAYGHASLQLGVANTLSTRFHIGSVTKMFIAAAVLRLSGDGLLSLRAHPADYVPQLAGLHPAITLHHLLSHTAGLDDIYEAPDLRVEMAALAARGEPLLDYLAASAASGEPGGPWRYSSTGFLLLAYVVEKIRGVSFGQVIDELFQTPLGLADTGPDDPRLVNPGRAQGQISTSKGWRNAQNDALANIDAPREFYSTVKDLDRWATAMQRGEVLDQETLALAFTRHADVGGWGGLDPKCGYGYGWFLEDGVRWISGMTAGFRAALWQYPDKRLNVVMLWNNERINSHAIMGSLRPILLRQ